MYRAKLETLAIELFQNKKNYLSKIQLKLNRSLIDLQKVEIIQNEIDYKICLSFGRIINRSKRHWIRLL